MTRFFTFLLFLITAYSITAQNNLDLADNALISGDYEIAVQLYSGLLENNQDDFTIYLKMGRAQNGLNQYANAIESFRHGLELAPENRMLIMKLAESYVNMNWFSNAEVLYNSLLTKDSSQIIITSLASLKIKEGNYNKALDHYKYLIHNDSLNYHYLRQAALCADKINKHKEAKMYFYKVLRVNPRDIVSRLRLAKILLLEDYLIETLALVEEGLNYYPEDHRLLLKKADAFYYLRDFELAIPVYSQLKKGDKADFETLKKLGISYYHIDDYECSFEQFDTLCKVKADDYLVNWYLGLSAKHLRQFDTAEFHITTAIKLATSVYMPRFHFQLGQVYAYKREYEKALEAYKKALEFDPGDIRFYFYVATTYEEMGANKLIAYQWYQDYINSCKDECDEDNLKYARNRVRVIKEQYFFEGESIRD